MTDFASEPMPPRKSLIFIGIGRLVYIALVALPVTSCSGTDSRALVASDSAGVHLIINPAVRNVTVEAALADSPNVTVGGTRDVLREEFGSQSGYLTAIRMSDGRIFAHDKDHIKHFDSNGRLVAVIGRAGDGPGEFRDVYGLCRFRGDSLLVTDRKRISILTSEGTIVREYIPAGWAVPNTCFEDGATLMAGVMVVDTARASATREYRVMSSTGEVLSTLSQIPATVYKPLYREVYYAIHNDSLYVGDPIETGVRVYDRSGTLRRIVRTRDEPEPLTEAELAELVGVPAAGSPTSQVAELRSARISRPFYTNMAVDGSGKYGFERKSIAVPTTDGLHLEQTAAC